ncbi:serine/threonine protein kinase [Bremerella cremea]|uniref:Serine/threonine protein kinase n=1 Tax=Bremerella cremea TaxID=1031537 RepID=A0A368KWC3_9BACT|nr:serine/threonine protein kinase [Bremerella cremea]
MPSRNNPTGRDNEITRITIRVFAIDGRILEVIEESFCTDTLRTIPLSSVELKPPISSSRRRSPRCLHGAWEVGPQLGEGTYFRVFRARPSQGGFSGWDFALKTIRPEFKGDRLLSERLIREAEAGAEITSAHVVPVIDARPGSFVVMPRVWGQTLSEILASGRSIPLGTAVWAARQLAQGLSTTHELGWIHGDVKPDNIILSQTGHATLIDLGFAQRVQLNLPCSSRKCDRQGTLRYLPPEMLSRSAPVLPQADTYSLGVILFELITGRQLFNQSTTEEIVRAQLSQRAPNVRCLVAHVPGSLDTLVAKMLAKDPLRRPSPDDALVKALAAVEIELLSPDPKMRDAA